MIVHMATFARLVITLLCAAASLVSCESTIIHDASSVIFDLGGTVLITRPESGAGPYILREDAHPKAGDIIETAQDGRVSLALLPGALLQVEPDSKLLIEKIKLGKNGFASTEGMQRSVNIRLFHGTLYAVVQWDFGSADCTIATPNGRLDMAAGGVCRIEALERQTAVVSAHGDFTFVPTDQTNITRLNSGHAQEWPSSHDPFPAEFDQGTLPHIQKARAVEQELLELQVRQRSTPFPWR